MRCVAGLLVLAVTLPLGAQAPTAAPNYRVQEGFPSGAILRLQKRAKEFQRGFGGGLTAPGIQSVILTSRVWNYNEQPITVAFLGGTTDLQAKIVATVTAWTSASNLRFDFGPAGAYRTWSRTDTSYSADVRISFDDVGYWSFVGTDSVDPSIASPNQASMNFQGFATTLPTDWQGVVLHEFGHAIGFEHEHQSPGSNCQAEFRFSDDPGYVQTKDMYGEFIPDPQGHRPGIYTVLGGPPNNWSTNTVDFNLKQLANTTDLRFSTFDVKSIMMYSFQSWMFVNGEQSACYTAENLTLSSQDEKAAVETYPAELNAAVRSALKNFNALQTILAEPRLATDIKKQTDLRVQNMK